MSATPAITAAPFWQSGRVPKLPAGPLPARVDALIIGGGYTGLSAARETASAGLSTLVLEAGPIGTGCSGRNGGQIAYSLKPTFTALSAAHGAERAFAVCREAFEAMAHVRSLAEQSDCDWQMRGCFFGAYTRRHFERMARDAEHQPPGLEQRISVVSRAEQRGEIASDYYHGGCVYHDDASVDPMKLLLVLLSHATARGAAVADHCPAESIRRVDGGFEVLTARGTVSARKVLIATNGYTGALSPWLRRRVIPIGSYQICTEPLGGERVRGFDSTRAQYRRFAPRGGLLQAIGRRRAPRLRRARGARPSRIPLACVAARRR